jgi:hypothetical protein
MECGYCGSTNDAQLGTEINIHLPGQVLLEAPSIFVFPKITACLDCGFAQLTFSEAEIGLIRRRLARRT